MVKKMFRQVHLHNKDKDLHQFVFRASPGDELKDFCMMRLTYSVSASPYIATQCLRQLAEVYHSSHPLASQIVKQLFYVEDVLAGAASTEHAILISACCYLNVDLFQGNGTQILQLC